MLTRHCDICGARLMEEDIGLSIEIKGCYKWAANRYKLFKMDIGNCCVHAFSDDYELFTEKFLSSKDELMLKKAERISIDDVINCMSIMADENLQKGNTFLNKFYYLKILEYLKEYKKQLI
ncbi:hypothetical protein [Pelosinus propionicus]|uniref:Uncharacterized protein n=1 Tax=Pelosinus propionicus DSM 13327 TaxID=1123291 RepID=A0A1I4N2W6_9FIRM|nr:hypothetical protein [Pelosinus propionicus]SFM09593.1 hypothetical protein SAMN04490355_104051 [Pelosinus propionicus DSM 13327]